MSFVPPSPVLGNGHASPLGTLPQRDQEPEWDFYHWALGRYNELVWELSRTITPTPRRAGKPYVPGGRYDRSKRLLEEIVRKAELIRRMDPLT
jgi:hypothetical protein